MKKFNFILIAALASFAALSCQKESLPQSTPEADLLPLVITTGDATKTYIADNGKDIHWHSGDKIKVYSDISIVGDNAQSYDFTMPDGFSPTGNYAKFEGKVVSGTNKVWAVYPSELASGATDTGILQVKLPATQNPYNGETHSFSQNLNISVATAPVNLEYELGLTQRPVVSENMTFYNTCALVKFTIPSGITNIKNVTVSTDQDIVGDMTIDYSGTIPAFGGIANGSKSISMTAAETFADGRDYYFVLAPVAISKLSIYVNTTDNKQYAATQTFTTPYQLVAGKYISLGKLNINNMPSFGVDFDIQDEGGFLNGTDVIFSFPSNKISNLNLTISKEGGSVVRTIKVDGPVTLNEYNQYISSYAIETVSTWPYLPKGTYTVSGTYDTEGGAASVNNITFEINTDPNFTVGRFNASTTYNKYVNEGASVANTYTSDGNTIWVTADDVAISDKILKNANYKDMLQVQFATSPNGNNYSANLADGLNVTLSNQKVGKYTSPSYVFDGKKVTFSAKTCYVTGLPHKAAPPKKSGSAPWTDNSSLGSLEVGMDWDDNGRIKIPTSKLYEPTITSPGFYSPVQSLKVYLYVKADLETKGRNRLGKKTYYPSKITCAINDKDLCNSTGPDGKGITNYEGLGGLYSFGSISSTDVEITSDTSLSLGNNELEIRNNGIVSTADPQWTTPSIYVKEVNLLYR